MKDAELLAIEQINKAGGVLGRKIDPIIEDAQSNFTETYPEKAKKLMVQDKVAVIFGCYTSVSRVNVRFQIEDHNGLLFYPANYEGGECSKNIIYTGGLLNQQVLPAVDWMLEKSYKKIYLIGTDYIYPRYANLVVKKYLNSKKLQPLAETETGAGGSAAQPCGRPGSMSSSVTSTTPPRAEVLTALRRPWSRRRTAAYVRWGRAIAARGRRCSRCARR